MPDTKLLRCIFGAAREHGVSNEELHEAIRAGFNKTSLKDLSDREAHKLIDGLRGRRDQARRDAQASHGRKGVDDNVEFLVNSEEMRMLQRAAFLRGWDDGTLDKFIMRQNRGSMIKTMGQFNKVFWALKAMNRRGLP